ncbi:helix-turn-helix domain-containing protein [Clostridium beijerinckii]|uniref:helix-turn-helix domain-containing protein n=1 Tax=Clostridium beijerinckii TaxID=1520 RepID=UPI001494939D|nr:helix-turn-helix transcriptional regulator [Clostridium beijerinckii]NOW07818.1 transcriptional regulator with XRE-family HTH domain [Clostridium beijerinckii]NYC04408.1 transcriptional regulator with XRE-family HTH domain [Clostridium beijerinckii]NYC05449.1 transcriptional regulator with XRE-family HTH domain [Clostridium beijerinckii]
MEIYERIKDLRKNILKLNQEDFSKNIGLSRSNIANIEVGRINLTDRVISDICKEYNVNENWLRTGEGEMFNELSKAELVANIVGNALQSDDEFVQNVFIALGQLSPEEWTKVKEFVNKIK